MSLQEQTLTPQAPNAPIEVSWDDAFDGKFPPTRQQRVQQAVTQAAEQVFTQPAVQANPERLHKAMDLVLAGAVTLQPDGTATVKSGSRAYQINGECTCEDARRRTTFCKHYLAVLIHKRATALLQGTAPVPERPEPSARQADAPASPAPLPPSAPASSAWDVHEAPASTCFKFRIGTMELMHTASARTAGTATPHARGPAAACAAGHPAGADRAGPQPGTGGRRYGPAAKRPAAHPAGPARRHTGRLLRHAPGADVPEQQRAGLLV